MIKPVTCLRYLIEFRLSCLQKKMVIMKARINSQFRCCPLAGCSRSSRPEVFCEKGVLRNFTKFIRKQLCQSLIFNKVAGPRPATLLKKRLWHRCFHVNFVKFLRTPFLTEHPRWLLLMFLP